MTPQQIVDKDAEWLRENADSLAEVDQLTVHLIDRLATAGEWTDAERLEQIRVIVAARKIVRREMTMTPVSGQNT